MKTSVLALSALVIGFSIAGSAGAASPDPANALDLGR